MVFEQKRKWLGNLAVAQAIPCLEKNEYNEEKVTNAINNYNLARIVAEEEVKTAEGLTKAIIERTI